MNELAARALVTSVIGAVHKTSQQAALGIGDPVRVREACGNTKASAISLLTALLCVKDIGQSKTMLLANAKFIDAQLGNGTDETQEALRRIAGSR